MTMTERQYSVDYDPGKRIIRLALVGQWDVETLHAYEQAITDTIAPLGGAGGLRKDLGFLVDKRNQGVQSKIVAEGLGAMILGGKDLKLPCAILLSLSALQKLQQQRVTASLSNTAIFTDEAKALAWLASEQSKAM
ncbi:MAG: hypothetical protein ABW128_23985 [Rhizorhabdus sp.]